MFYEMRILQHQFWLGGICAILSTLSYSCCQTTLETTSDCLPVSNMSMTHMPNTTTISLDDNRTLVDYQINIYSHPLALEGHYINGSSSYCSVILPRNAEAVIRPIFFQSGGSEVQTTESSRDRQCVDVTLQEVPTDWVIKRFYSDVDDPYRLRCWSSERFLMVSYDNKDPNGRIAFVLNLQVSTSSNFTVQCGTPPFPLINEPDPPPETPANTPTAAADIPTSASGVSANATEVRKPATNVQTLATDFKTPATLIGLPANEMDRSVAFTDTKTLRTDADPSVVKKVDSNSQSTEQSQTGRDPIPVLIVALTCGIGGLAVIVSVISFIAIYLRHKKHPTHHHIPLSEAPSISSDNIPENKTKLALGVQSDAHLHKV